jgi:hypothetical protein
VLQQLLKNLRKIFFKISKRQLVPPQREGSKKRKKDADEKITRTQNNAGETNHQLELSILKLAILEVEKKEEDSGGSSSQPSKELQILRLKLSVLQQKSPHTTEVVVSN